MKFSLDNLLSNALQTFKRFPLAILSSLYSGYLIWILMEMPGTDKDHEPVIRVLFAASLGLPLLTSLQLFLESIQKNSVLNIIIKLIVIFILILYYYLLPEHITVKTITRYIALMTAFHLAVSFAPYLYNHQRNGFWQFNRILFIRFLTATLYSLVLFGGLALALLAIDQLFNVDLSEKPFIRLWCFIISVFNTWFFLSGVPVNIRELENINDYPKGLKIFTQYVLLPLVTVYLLILYAYTLRILFISEWPRGWVSWLVLGFSTAGILALLLIWPLRNDERFKWIRQYSRGFFIALFPLIILLFFAIGRRVSDYGITVNRYYVIILAVWLALNAAYFLFSRIKYIRFIPLSLFITAVISAYGPQSAFSISSKSQKKRFESLLEKNKLLQEGKIRKLNQNISEEDRYELSEITSYLNEVSGTGDLQEYFIQDLDSMIIADSLSRYQQPEKILALAGIEFSYYPGTVNAKETYYNLSIMQSGYYDISGYDHFIRFNIYTGRDKTVSSVVKRNDTLEFICSYTEKDSLLAFKFSQSEWDLDMRSWIENIIIKKGRSNYQLNSNDLSIKFNNPVNSRLFIESIAGEIADDSLFNISSMEAVILIGSK